MCSLLVLACAPTTAGPAQPASAVPPAAAASVPAVAAATSPASAAALIPLRVTYPAPAGAMAPAWVAYERGIFWEQGLDAELVFLSGTRSDQGVITGDTPIGFGVNVIPGRLSGADLIAIASNTNYMPYMLYARPGITTPQDLRGKTLVGTLPGATNSVATLITARHFGLEPNRDVFIQPTQGTAEQLAIMVQGLADGALLTPPASLKADEAGLVSIANLTELNIPFMAGAVGTTATYARDHPDTVRRALRAYVAAIARARRDPEGTKELIGKYTQTEDQAILDDTYRFYSPLWGRPDFRVPPEAVASILGVLDAPGAATARPEEFIDNRFVDELHDSGFIRQSGALD
jgi:ABC-type nitrate/sulfonate/bicarbonate transport system substrate-binding protein